jgi:hypothetical protein
MPTTELQLAPPTDRNSLLPKVATASIVMVLVGVAVFFLNPRRTSVLSVQKVNVFSPRTHFEATATQNKIIGEAASTEDDLYAVATLQVTDKLQIPISVDSTSATLTTADGSVVQATVVSPQDVSRLETMFPQIAPLVASAPKQQLLPGTLVAPGTTQTGSVLLLFPQVAAKDWQSRKSATVTVNLAHDLPPLTSTVH